MADSFVQGNAVRSRVTFRDVDGDLLDPATVVCRVRAPDGTETDYVYGVDAGVVRDSEGVYRFWIATEDASGTYVARWVGIDADGNEIAGEAEFDVEATAFETADP